MPYQILDWGQTYENARSRTIDRTSWCSVPNQQDGLGYRRLAREHPEYYAVFIAIVLACSKQAGKVRNGWLTDDGMPTGIPWDVEDIHDKTGMPKEIIGPALEYLCSDRVKWMKYDGHRKKLGA